MFKSIFSRAFDWNWLRKEISESFALWLIKKLEQADREIQDIVCLNDKYPPGEATARLAQKYGGIYLRKPLIDTIEELADRLDGKGDYLRAGVRTFREKLKNLEAYHEEERPH